MNDGLVYHYVNVGELKVPITRRSKAAPSKSGSSPQADQWRKNLQSICTKRDSTAKSMYDDDLLSTALQAPT